jgi:hypothetical protein
MTVRLNSPETLEKADQSAPAVESSWIAGIDADASRPLAARTTTHELAT